MSDDSRYTIRELVEKTGVPAASIHHYRNEGLLPPPERVGARRFRYSDQHVQALRLIRLLRERRRLPLSEIKDVLPELLAGGDEQAFHTSRWDDVVTGRTEAAEVTRGRIVAAAVSLFAARGYAGVAVNDVAVEAGVAKGSLYRYFESKDALFAAAVESIVARVVDAVAAEAERAGTDGLLEPKAAIPALLVAAWPGVMILLDLAAGSLRDQPGQRALADAALTRFVDGVGPLLVGPGSPRERAIALIVQLAHETMRAVLGSD
jgi:AcrR family transcriptional regulator/predicted DNA-binding transcriptional regulator AlpA